jgi:hypothetical protein
LNGQPTIQPDWHLLILLGVIVVASSIVFALSVYRETHHRAKRRLADWAERNRFQWMNLEFGVPRPLDRLTNLSMRLVMGLYNRNTRLLHIRTPAPNADEFPGHWNLAIRQVPGLSPPVGLRPRDAKKSFLDFFRLEHAPTIAKNERFILIGDDLLASRKLSDGSGRALLPADLSLLRIDEFLVIDFSARPFDEIEIGRMIALLDQLASIV